MASLRIEAPSAAAAFVLVDRLTALGASAEQTSRGGWAIVVPLDGSPKGTVPECLARAQEWLDLCSLASTSVTVDGHTHLLRSNRVPAGVK
jgi:hypothetical protein